MFHFWVLSIFLELCLLFSYTYQKESEDWHITSPVDVINKIIEDTDRITPFLPPTREAQELVVMTFNAWDNGSHVDDGLDKIIKHIKSINPDFIALQEVCPLTTLAHLVKMIGHSWTGIGIPEPAILTRHEVIKGSMVRTSRGVGFQARVKPYGKLINFWSVRLDHKGYGPYKVYSGKRKITILAGEIKRTQQIRQVYRHKAFREALMNIDMIPLIVAGDFNSPSHLDWIKETRELHNKRVIAWPATKMLQDETGLIDSYREVHPNVTLYPGITWSTTNKLVVEKVSEPQDRIDFIFYKGGLLSVEDSVTYAGKQFVFPAPFHQNNDYPSDHYAVITRFTFY